MKSHQAVKEQPQQGGHGVLWLDPGDGAWSGGSRNHQLQQAVWMGASLPNIPGRKGDALHPSCEAEFRLFRVRTRDAVLSQSISLSRAHQPP